MHNFFKKPYTSTSIIRHLSHLKITDMNCYEKNEFVKHITHMVASTMGLCKKFVKLYLHEPNVRVDCTVTYS